MQLPAGKIESISCSSDSTSKLTLVQRINGQLQVTLVALTGNYLAAAKLSSAMTAVQATSLSGKNTLAIAYLRGKPAFFGLSQKNGKITAKKLPVASAPTEITAQYDPAVNQSLVIIKQAPNYITTAKVDARGKVKSLAAAKAS